MRLLIKNAIVIMVDGITKINNVVLENGIIADLNDCQVDSDSFDLIIEAGDLFLAPGFIDIHAHGNSGVDIMEADQNGLEKMAGYQLSRGVTSFLGASLSADRNKLIQLTIRISDYVKSQKDDISELLGLYLEGPYFNPSRKGAHPLDCLRIPDIEEMEVLLEHAGDLIKVVSLAPELDGAIELIRYLNRRNVKVALGHTDATYQDTMRAIELGASIATHLFNAMAPLHHREPGVAGACLESDRVFAELIADGVHLHDAAIRLAIRSKGTDKIVLVSDQISAAGLADGQYYLGGERVFVVDGVARNPEGKLAGSSGDLLQGLKRLVNVIGVKLEDAIKMVSGNPAKAIGIHERVGRIDRGMRADLLLLDNKLNIVRVIKSGNIVLSN